jgi:hypothetical protein
MTRRDEPHGEETFTVVFKGNLQAIAGNPFHVESAFGKPIAIARGNALDELAELECTDGVSANMENEK